MARLKEAAAKSRYGKGQDNDNDNDHDNNNDAGANTTPLKNNHLNVKRDASHRRLVG